MSLEQSYIALAALVFILLMIIGFHAIGRSTEDSRKKRQYKILMFLGMSLWQIYVFLLAKSGFLATFSLPPRMPLLLIVPLFSFTGIFLWRQRKKEWIMQIPILWLTAFQSFRIIVESLFVWSISAGILIELVTIKGHNYDMLVGLTAPLAALILVAAKKTPVRFLKAWNRFGLIILAGTVFLFMTTAFFPELHGYEQSPLPVDFGLYPYVLVPGLLMPSAVFVHILSLLQLRRMK